MYVCMYAGFDIEIFARGETSALGGGAIYLEMCVHVQQKWNYQKANYLRSPLTVKIMSK